MDKNKRNLLLAAAAGLATTGLITAVAKRKPKCSVSKKVTLVTGGSRGLGLVLARQLLREGARVAICARDSVELEKAKRQLDAISKENITIATDLNYPNQIKEMLQIIKDKWGPVEILINNAGIVQVGPVESMASEDFKRCMDIHFWAPFHTMAEVLPDMIKKEKGRIVNISSIGGKISFPHMMPYNASKFALTGLSEGFHSELKKYGINVTTVCPGLIQTGSPRQAEFKGQNQKEYAWFAISDSLSALSMDAEKVASKIISAMKKGDAELILSLQAKVATAIHGVAPGLTSEILGYVNKLLPSMKGSSDQIPKKGYESESKWVPSFWTKNNQKAEKQNNEI